MNMPSPFTVTVALSLSTCIHSRWRPCPGLVCNHQERGDILIAETGFPSPWKIFRLLERRPASISRRGVYRRHWIHTGYHRTKTGGRRTPRARTSMSTCLREWMMYNTEWYRREVILRAAPGEIPWIWGIADCLGKNIAGTFYADPVNATGHWGYIRNGPYPITRLPWEKRRDTAPGRDKQLSLFRWIRVCSRNWRDVAWHLWRKRLRKRCGPAQPDPWPHRMSTLAEAFELVLDAALHDENLDSGGIYLLTRSPCTDIVVHRGYPRICWAYLPFWCWCTTGAAVKTGTPFYGRNAISGHRQDEIRDRNSWLSPHQFRAAEGNLVAVLNLASHVHDTVRPIPALILRRLQLSWGVPWFLFARKRPWR